MDGVQSVSPIAEATELSCGCKVVGVISLKKEPYRVSLGHSTGTSRPSRMQIRQWLKQKTMEKDLIFSSLPEVILDQLLMLLGIFEGAWEFV